MIKKKLLKRDENKSLKQKICDPYGHMPRKKKSSEKCTVVRRYYNTDLRRLKNRFLDK
jgi:hypothetical protein